MPRYHFDLVDSKTLADAGGQELPDDIAAMDVADAIAKRLSVERPEFKNGDFAILVTSDEGEEICRVLLSCIELSKRT
jgi:hypothetical protein